MQLEDAMEQWLAEKGWEIEGQIYVSHKLMFHYALLVNPDHHTYDHRYCYKNLALMTKAMVDLKKTGKLRYWHKDHTNNISVHGKYLYPPGMLQEPEYSIGEVDWVVE